MNSAVLATIHIVVVNLFLLIYLIKTILLFSNVSALEKFTKATKVIEMIISTLFLVTGIWLFVILGAIKMLHIVKLVGVLVVIPLSVIGFKKKNKALALLSFVILVGVYGLAEASKNKPFIPNNVVVHGIAVDAPSLGIKTFVANCAMCHGLDGKKKYRDAADLSSSSLSSSLISQLVKEGSKSKMPAFKDKLSADEISAAADLILSWHKK